MRNCAFGANAGGSVGIPSTTLRGTGRRPGGLSAHEPFPQRISYPSLTRLPTLSSLGAPGSTRASTVRPNPDTSTVALPTARTCPLAVSTTVDVGRTPCAASSGPHTCSLAPVSATHPRGLHRALLGWARRTTASASVGFPVVFAAARAALPLWPARCDAAFACEGRPPSTFLRSRCPLEVRSARPTSASLRPGAAARSACGLGTPLSHAPSFRTSSIPRHFLSRSLSRPFGDIGPQRWPPPRSRGYQP